MTNYYSHYVLLCILKPNILKYVALLFVILINLLGESLNLPLSIESFRFLKAPNTTPRGPSSAIIIVIIRGGG